MNPDFIKNNSFSDFVKKDSIFVFHHIHKTGGTSLENIFSKWFYYKRDYNQYSSLPVQYFKNFIAFGGHYGYKNISVLDKYPFIFDDGRFKVVTFLRDPLERSVSHYFHWKNMGYLDFQNLKLTDFISGNSKEKWINALSNNWQSKMLNCEESSFQNVLDKYFFIGLFESLQESTDLLARKFKKTEVVLPHFRKGTKKNVISTLTDSQIAAFKQRNELDYLIFNYAKVRFEKEKLEMRNTSSGYS